SHHSLRNLPSFPTRRSSDLGFARSTASTSTVAPALVMVSLKPLQRRSRAAFPTSWLTHNACLTPATAIWVPPPCPASNSVCPTRSEEHTSELQSRFDLVCRL